jgi:hypothetical protein
MWRQQRLEAGQRKSGSDEIFRSRADHGDNRSHAEAQAQAEAQALLFVVGWRVGPGAVEFLVVGFVVSQFLVVCLLR